MNVFSGEFCYKFNMAQANSVVELTLDAIQFIHK